MYEVSNDASLPYSLVTDVVSYELSGCRIKTNLSAAVDGVIVDNGLRVKTRGKIRSVDGLLGRHGCSLLSWTVLTFGPERDNVSA